MPLPPTMIGKGDVIRLHPEFISRCLFPGISESPVTVTRLRNLRGRIIFIKIPTHTRTAFAYIEWLEQARAFNNKYGTPSFDGEPNGWFKSSITSPWLNLGNVQLVDQETYRSVEPY